MINIFYQPDYAKRKKKLIAFKFNKTIFFNKLIDLAYNFNFSIPDNLITNGPHKLFNNIVKISKFEKEISLNKFKHNNHYIVQFDNYGQKKLDEIIKSKNEFTKVLVGPLYTLEHLKILLNYVKTYKFIKVVTCSRLAKKTIIHDLKFQFEEHDVVVLPIGIKSEKTISKIKKFIRNDRCLVYFKNRNKDELNQVTGFLDLKNFKYDVLEYGNYDNKILKNYSKKNKFGILINSTESQGFAIQEIMSFNLPLLVWDKKIGEFEGRKINGSSVTIWNESCGMVVDSFQEFKDNFDSFVKNIDNYNPVEIVKEKLTYEKFLNNLKREYLDFY